MRTKTEVFYWKYNDGWLDIPLVLQAKYKATREFNKELIGWHCWVYPVDDIEFEKWMKKNMKGKYDCTHRYNSGDPMYTVLIYDDEDATLFKLMWM
jgi:hypothetical protein